MGMSMIVGVSGIVGVHMTAGSPVVAVEVGF
jgi:hypothetical protein